MNSASTAESSCNLVAMASSEILEYDKLIILTPVLMTLCLNLMIKVQVFSLTKFSPNASSTWLNLAKFPVRTAWVSWKYGCRALRSCGFLKVALSGISPNKSSTTMANFCACSILMIIVKSNLSWCNWMWVNNYDLFESNSFVLWCLSDGLNEVLVGFGIF